MPARESTTFVAPFNQPEGFAFNSSFQFFLFGFNCCELVLTTKMAETIEFTLHFLCLALALTAIGLFSKCFHFVFICL